MVNRILNAIGVVAFLGVLFVAQGDRAQGQGKGKGGGGPQQPQTAKGSSPIDLTGYWVSVVTEDWRYRMVMPTKGDFQGIGMTPEGRKLADAFDPAKPTGDACASYGAPAVLRIPGRLHLTWQDDTTLKMETDAGKQTRLFHFGNWQAPAGPATRQGNTKAAWERGGGRGAANGWMTATTDNLMAGLLRKNGVPYSDATTLTEHYDLIKMPNGDPLLVVTVITTDAKYLRAPLIITTHFRKEATEAKWHPSECSSTW